MTDAPTGYAAWHETLVARDPSRIPGLLADDATFRSPAVHTPQVGRDVVTGYLTAALKIIANETFHYERQWFAEDSAVLEFVTEVDGLTVHGIDMITWDADGLINDFTVMIRPLKALNKVVELMGAELLRMLEPAGS